MLGPGSPRKNTWSSRLAEVIGKPELAGLITKRPAMLTSPARALKNRPDETEVFFPARPDPAPRSATLPVTALQDFALCPRRYAFNHLVGLQERMKAPRPIEGDAPGDIRERGTAAHRLLELVPLEVIGTEQQSSTLSAIELSEGLPDDDEVRAWVERFLATRFGAQMKSAGEGRVHRELSFLLRLGDEFTLHLKGQIDLLLVENENQALVVDYKTTRAPPDGLEAYRFQLGCYALAASHFLKPGTTIRTAIAFLRDEDPTPRIDDTLPTAAAALEAELVAQARALVQSQVKGVWDGRPRNRCEAIGCGYVARCHPV